MPSTSPVQALNVRINPTDTFIYTLNPVESNISRTSSEEIKCHISTFLDTVEFEPLIKDEYNQSFIIQELKKFYELKDFGLVWSSLSQPLPTSELMLNHLLTAGSHGLNAQEYEVSKLINFQQNVFSNPFDINLVQLILLDIRLSIAYISYAWHVHNGRTAPRVYPGRWSNDRVNGSVASVLAQHDISKALKMLEPKHSNYGQLLKALELYRVIQHEGGWKTLPLTIKLKPGDTSIYVPDLRKRLVASRDLSIGEEEIARDSIFDIKLEDAVKRFQYRHGLESDGVVGKGTVAALNVSVEERINQIVLNLERLRWLSNDLGDHYLYVNIPEYKLYIKRKGETTLDMRVIVGSKDNATPVFNEVLEYIVFSPTWNVPKSIIYEEIIPKIKRDPGFLKRGNYVLYKGTYRGDEPLNPDSLDWSTIESDIRVVQQPGPGNALGRVKFLMPNRMNIYLHDTPADYLFNRTKRAMSHGCIRLEYPEKLAEYLLQNKDWDISKVIEYMHKDSPEWVTLPEKVPVHLMYQTAFVDKMGLPNFREDIYGLDKLQMQPIIETQNGQYTHLIASS